VYIKIFAIALIIQFLKIRFIKWITRSSISKTFLFDFFRIPYLIPIFAPWVINLSKISFPFIFPINLSYFSFWLHTNLKYKIITLFIISGSLLLFFGQLINKCFNTFIVFFLILILFIIKPSVNIFLYYDLHIRIQPRPFWDKPFVYKIFPHY